MINLIELGFTVTEDTREPRIDERNHVENPLLDQLEGMGWEVTALMQDLITGKMRVTPLLGDGMP